MRTVTKALIPAAGMGTRFLPATIAQPKEMLIVVDKPVIQYVVEESVEAGIADILIVTGRHKRAIEDHFDPSFELENMLVERNKQDVLEILKSVADLANLHFVRQKRQRGLADAIYQGKTFIGDEPFVVLLGDTIIDSTSDKSILKEMIEIYEKTGKSVVAVEEVERKNIPRYGIIDGTEREKGIYDVADLVEKPDIDEAPSNLAIASRYVFTPGIFSLIEQTKPGKGGEIQITDTMKYLAKIGELIALKINGKRYDIGNKTDFVTTNIDFALKNPEMKTEIRNYLKKSLEMQKKK
jgi:UTP--glucose-1-phosphate uridylyltransferase